MYDHPSKSRPSVDRSPTLERSEDDRPSTRAGERPIRAGTERYAPSSPVKHEIWKPNVPAEEEAAGTRRGLGRRGSTASQRSVGSNSIRSLPTEPILERPDDAILRKNEGEQVSASPDKGKERQHSSRTFQLATEPVERWDELPIPSSRLPPNSAPPGSTFPIHQTRPITPSPRRRPVVSSPNLQISPKTPLQVFIHNRLYRFPVRRYGFLAYRRAHSRAGLSLSFCVDCTRTSTYRS